MGKLRKVGIGFGIIVGLFFALIIALAVSIEMEKANMTPEELQQWEKEREAERLIREQKAEKKRLVKEAEALQREIDEKRESESRELIKLSQEKWDERIESELIISKLDPIKIQKIKNEFPILLEHQKKNLRDCQNIDSFEAYLNSLSKFGGRTLEETIEEYEFNHSMIFWDLSNQGYDKHPEIKSLFKETESASLQVLYCMDNLYVQYSLEFLK